MVLGVEKNQAVQIEQKICILDDHVMMAFTGRISDVHKISNLAREEFESYKLTFGRPVTLKYISNYIAGKLKFGRPITLKYITNYMAGKQCFSLTHQATA